MAAGDWRGGAVAAHGQEHHCIILQPLKRARYALCTVRVHVSSAAAVLGVACAL